MLVGSSLIMALAWLGHLRLKNELSFASATLLAWLLVLPEYALNIKALRMGYGLYSGGQMAALRLASGVVAVAVVSRFVLNEALTLRKLLGFGVMILAMVLIVSKRTIEDRASIPPS
ncbi:MAG TPA: small multidrug resistance protein [Polyangiaceae bacterium]|nr:small multidrug resistance protein [Polyangiaceae bacterium]